MSNLNGTTAQRQRRGDWEKGRMGESQGSKIRSPQARSGLNGYMYFVLYVKGDVFRRKSITVINKYNHEKYFPLLLNFLKFDFV